MDKVLRPERFDDAQDASKSWRHGLTTFENFVEVIPDEEVNKLDVLINYMSPRRFINYSTKQLRTMKP